MITASPARHRLGRSDVFVTELSFGGAAIGNLYTPVDDETARAAVDAAWAGGIRAFDTAPLRTGVARHDRAACAGTHPG